MEITYSYELPEPKADHAELRAAAEKLTSAMSKALDEQFFALVAPKSRVSFQDSTWPPEPSCRCRVFCNCYALS